MKKIKFFLLLAAAFFSVNAWSQNCDVITPEVTECNAAYDHDFTVHEADRVWAEAQCEYEYDYNVAEAVSRWESSSEQYLPYLQEELNYWSGQLNDCIDEAFYFWVDEHMRDADSWNYCLCNSGCSWYCSQ